MAKLHELLAVHNNLKGQTLKVLTDLKATFGTKKHLFTKKLVKFISSVEEIPDSIKEQSDIQSSVKQEIDWVSKILSNSIDASYAIDVANTEAKADVILEDGTVLLKDVPATALLQLEKTVREVSELVKTVPTLDPAKGFKLDPDSGDGWYAAREVEVETTRKQKKIFVLYAATVQHPAQTQLIDEDVKVGVNRTQEWSTMITPAQKAQLIERAEMLFRAVTQARSRANDQTIDQAANKIGDKLLGYVFSPLG